MRLSSRVLKLLKQSAAQRESGPIPIRLRRALRPALGTLEPRLVLNATAELNSLGQLIISGSDVADVVSLETNAADQLLIRDGAGAIIPISGHPGSSTDPLDRSAITSNQLIIDLGAGDDVMSLQVSSGLSVTALGGSGTDISTLAIVNPVAFPNAHEISITSESIQLLANQTIVDLRSTQVTLAGAVLVGDANSVTNVLLEGGSLTTTGSLTLRGDVNISGSGASVDLANATLSSSSALHDLRITLGTATGNEVRLGEADGSSGALVHDVTIQSANVVRIQNSSLQIAGAFRVTEATSFEADADIEARQVDVTSSESISIRGTIEASNGGIRLDAGEDIFLAGELNGSLVNDQYISISAPELTFDGLQIITRGGGVFIEGTTTLLDTLSIDTGANQLATTPGIVFIQGQINGFSGADLLIDARGTSTRGLIGIDSPVGNVSQIGRVVLIGSFVDVASIEARGALTIDSSGTFFRGRLRSLGDISVSGVLTSLPEALTITGNHVSFAGPVIGELAAGSPFNSQSISIVSTGNVTFNGRVANLADLSVNAAGKTTFRGPLTLQGELFVDGSLPTEISSPSITTGGTQTFSAGANFVSSGTLSATEVSFGGPVIVGPDATYVVNAPVVGTALIKDGVGTLVLAESNRYTGATTVMQGALRIDGTTAVGAQPIQLTGGRLEGKGLIQSEVIAQNASQIGPGPMIARLTVAGLDLSADTRYDVQIQGVSAGTQHDQIVVSNSSRNPRISLGGAELRFSFEPNAEAATEYIVLRNDSDSVVEGNFSTRLSPSGEILQSSRLLTEGSLVTNNFGGSGRPAYITYRGGDGNDVAIVTAGDVVVAAGPTTLVQRRGSNLEIRTGADLATARLATPTIRPIAALNDYQVLVRGSDNPESLVVDLDGWIQETAGAIQFTGTILFESGGGRDLDSISLTDLLSTTDDRPRAIQYSLNGDRSGSVNVIAAPLDSQFDIQFTQLESFTQELDVAENSFQFSDLDEVVTLSRDSTSPQRTLIQSSTSSGSSTDVSFANPNRQLVLNSGGGGDTIRIDGLGLGSPNANNAGFFAAITMDGQAGDDRVEVNAELSLGRSNVTGNFEARAETISIATPISTTNGIDHGAIRLVGGTRIEVLNDALLLSGNAKIDVDANAGEFDSSSGQLVSQNQDDAISITNASQIRLGDVAASRGALTLETAFPGGTITQAATTRIVTNRIIVDTVGDVQLANPGNDFKNVERIDSTADVVLNDSIDDLVITSITSTGQIVRVATSGNLSVAANGVIARNASVTLEAGNAILDSRTSNNTLVANVVASELNLVAGSNRSGGTVGFVDRPLVVSVSDALNVDSASSNGDIFVSSPSTPLPIGLIQAGSGTVFLSGLSIDDANQDEISDISAKIIRLDAAEGIGSRQKLELSEANRLIASTISGGIDLTHQSIEPLVVERLNAGSGDIRIVHAGSPSVTVQRVTSGEGNVLLANQTGSVIVDSENNTAAIQIANQGTLQIIASGVQADVKIRDSITTSTGDISLVADHDVLFEAGEIISIGGDILVTADARPGNQQGVITMTPSTRFATTNGQIILNADGDIRLTSLETGNATETAILIQSNSGSVLNHPGNAAGVTNLIAQAGGARLVAKTGIGNGNALTTELAVLDAKATAAGPVQINELSEIELRSVETADGSISVTAGGTITATQVISLNPNRVDDPRGNGTTNRDIVLTATGRSSDLRIGQIIAMHTADVRLFAGDDVLRNDGSSQLNVLADDLAIGTRNGQGDGNLTIDLTTNVNDLTIAATGTHRGDIQIREQDSIRLASSDSANDANAIQTTNGMISIEAFDSILISDADPTNDGADLKSDTEIFAGGVNGRIYLLAAKSMELAGTVEVVATSTERHSLILEANQVAFGETIELRTADESGVARWFSPRPNPVWQTLPSLTSPRSRQIDLLKQEPTMRQVS
jgi:autotransporter-associated beta strand protein